MIKILKKILNPIAFNFDIGGGGGSSAPAPATTTTTTTPWGPTKSFWNRGTYDPKTGLYGLNKNAKGPLGLLQQTSNFSNQYKNLSPQEQQLLSDYQTTLGGRNVGIENMQGLGSNLQNDLTSGRYNTNFSDVGNTDYSNIDAATAEAARANAATAEAARANAATADAARAEAARAEAATANAATADAARAEAATANAATADAARAEAARAEAATAETTLSDLMNARSAQGALDPTSSLSQILKGDPTTNPYIAQMNQASINQAMQGYNDALQKTTQNVLPQIKQDAFASGQYGGSRQGIAEGIIGQQLGINARDLGQRAMDTGAQLYGGAFENAQQRMAAAAGDLNAQAAQNEQFNASSLNNMGQFNVGNQQAINLANMQALNDMSQFNAGNQQAVNLANIQALNNMGQFNASSLNDMGQFNAANQQDVNLSNMQALNDMGQFNAANQQDVNLSNMQALNNMSQFNATNALQNAQYNADLGLKNRSMSMEQAQNNLNNALQAYNTGKATYADVTSAQDALYGAQTDAEKTQMQRYLDMLNIQQGVYGGASGLGGSSTATTTGGGGSSSGLGNILGGLAGGAGLLSMFKG